MSQADESVTVEWLSSIMRRETKASTRLGGPVWSRAARSHLAAVVKGSRDLQAAPVSGHQRSSPEAGEHPALPRDPRDRDPAFPEDRFQWENGKVYYALNGKTVNVPAAPADQPDSALLRWHNDTIFEKDAA